MKRPYNLLVVDDSSLIRKAIGRIFDSCSEIEIVGEAVNGQEALDMIPDLNPDVVTMDINMPVMDGITALKHLMIKCPKPTVMCSTLTKEGAAITFDALKYGAIDFICKPSNVDGKDLEQQYNSIRKKVSLAAEVEIENVRRQRANKRNRRDVVHDSHCEYMFAIGASAGGYGTLLKIIPYLSPDLHAAFLVVMYAEAVYLDAFSVYLNKISDLTVKRAIDGDVVKSGVCYIASGEEYVTFESTDDGKKLIVSPAPFPTHRGAINMLMFSLSEVMKNRSVGIILSGEGHDGTEGMEEILRVGGSTIVQEPKSSFCKEMPCSILEKCKVHLITSELNMPDTINASFAVF